MSIDLEDQLTAGMRDEAAGIAFSGDILDRASRRHHRRVALRNSAYAAGVVGLAGTLAAVLAVGGGGPAQPGAGRPPVAGADAPGLRLASAITASTNTSYRLQVTVGDRHSPASRGTAEGAFDPRTRTGYLDSRQPGIDAVYHQRLIDGVLYLGSSGSTTWKQEPSDGRLEYADALGATAGSSADPDQLFAALRAENASITRTGAQAYHFASSRPYDDQYATGTAELVGDVTLDGSGRIARVSYESTNKGQLKPGVKNGESFASGHVVTMEFSAYGVPVRVEKPTDVVVAK